METKPNRTALRLRKIPANTVIHTPTEAEAKELLAILKENGYMWCSSEDPTKHSNWKVYKENTCYNLTSLGVAYGNRKFYNKEGRSIITLVEFKERYCYVDDTCTDDCSSAVQVKENLSRSSR